jgi:hypothetical protein
MKKCSLLFAVLVLIPASSSAQLGIKWGIGANVAIPSADLGDFVATGFGGTGMVKFGLIPIIDVTAGLEYVKFTGKDITQGSLTGEGEGNAWGYIVGGRISVLPPLLYAGLETGAYTFTAEFTAPSVPSTDNSDTKFFVGPMVGVNLGMLDANLRYVWADGNDFASLRGMIWF